MNRRHISTALVVGFLSLAGGCKDYLNVNTNPNAPESVSANLYLSPMEHWMVTSPQYDGRYIGQYTQQWIPTQGVSTLGTWVRMGYDPTSDNGAEQWRDVYWSLGQNLVDMINKSEKEQRWDLAGVGYFMKAWGWMVLTDMHGEIIVKEAIDPTRSTFDYDTQDYVYSEVLRLVGVAITDLQRTDGAVDPTYLGRTDNIYQGDRTKWLKAAYGLQALALNHFSNKSTYKPSDVIASVDKSLASESDDALLAYPCIDSGLADCNFWGRSRSNITNYRQTAFVVNLMNGTDFGPVDPRMSRMLSPAPDGVYRGMDINVPGYGALTTAQQPNNFFGYPVTGGTLLPSRYFFDDKSKFPFMTYAQLQFVKAEAAFRSGDKATALAAYKNGISAHIDFVNARNLDNNQATTQISPTEKATFLADPRIVPTSASSLTITQIMTQKYIAQWGWGHNELFMDMRRYHWTDVDPATGAQVYPGFAPPTTLYGDNNGKVAQRMRPRYNSEYVWNFAALKVIGGDQLDYHTKPIWITQP
jgi:hypothetical protein